MEVIIFLLSAFTLAKGGQIGFPSSYSSVSGSQYHPKEWSDNSIYGSSSSSSHGLLQQQIYNQHVPVIKNGVPVETPEVQAAKAHFYSEYQRAAALAAQKPDPLDGQYAEEHEGGKYLPTGNVWSGAERRSQDNSVWANSNDNIHNYVPEETPEVQQAKAAHYQAHSTALRRAYDNQHRYRRTAEWANDQKYQGPIHIPQITEEGVPAETVEVQKAKLIHYQALNEAASRAQSSGHYDDQSGWDGQAPQGQQAYGAPQAAGWPSTPVKVSYEVNHIDAKWDGPTHIPIIGHDGVPLDTPEVQHARKAHLAALAEESLKHKGWEGSQQKGWQPQNKW